MTQYMIYKTFTFPTQKGLIEIFIHFITFFKRVNDIKFKNSRNWGINYF